MLTAKDVMITDVYSVQETDTVETVLKTFAARGISGAPIVNSARRAVGYISDGDIMRQLGHHESPTGGYIGWARAVAYLYSGAYEANAGYMENHYLYSGDYDAHAGETEDQLKSNVRELLGRSITSIGSRKPITVDVHEPLVNVAELLANKNIKKVPIIEDGVVVGVISRGDIVRFVVKLFVNR